MIHFHRYWGGDEDDEGPDMERLREEDPENLNKESYSIDSATGGEPFDATVSTKARRLHDGTYLSPPIPGRCV